MIWRFWLIVIVVVGEVGLATLLLQLVNRQPVAAVAETLTTAPGS